MLRVIIPDVHVPYHDVKAWEKVLDFIDKERPDEVIQLGDFAGFDAISRFPDWDQKRMRFTDELTVLKYEARRLTEASRKAAVKLIGGNHEERLNKYLVINADKLIGVKGVTVPELLELEDIGIEYIGVGGNILVGTWPNLYIIEHGDRSSSESGATAKRMMEARGTSGVSGHTHRAAAYYKTNKMGTRKWLEAGNLVDKNSHAFSYDTTQNWQQAFVVMEQRPNKITARLIDIDEI